MRLQYWSIKKKYSYEKSYIGNVMLSKMLKMTETQSQKLIFYMFLQAKYSRI